MVIALRMARIACALSAAGMLQGCVGAFSPPGEFAVQTATNLRTKRKALGYYAIVRDAPLAGDVPTFGELGAECEGPTCSQGIDYVKQDYARVLLSICKADPLPSTEDPCVLAVIKNAVDQCVMKSGMTNRFAAAVNVGLAGANAAAAVATGVFLGVNGKDDATAGALSVAALGNTGNFRNFVPATVAPSAKAMIEIGKEYAGIGGFTPTDGACLHGGGPCTTSAARRPVFLRFARLHDAVYAACPVGAY